MYQTTKTLQKYKEEEEELYPKYVNINLLLECTMSESIICPASLIRLGVHNISLTKLPTEANISKNMAKFLPPKWILIFDKRGQFLHQTSGNLSLKDGISIGSI